MLLWKQLKGKADIALTGQQTAVWLVALLTGLINVLIGCSLCLHVLSAPPAFGNICQHQESFARHECYVTNITQRAKRFSDVKRVTSEPYVLQTFDQEGCYSLQDSGMYWVYK